MAKWARGTYQCDGRGTSWLKIKNPEYSQMEGGTSGSRPRTPSGAPRTKGPGAVALARLKPTIAVGLVYRRYLRGRSRSRVTSVWMRCRNSCSAGSVWAPVAGHCTQA